MNSKKTAQYVMLAEASYADLIDENGKPINSNAGKSYFDALERSSFAKKDSDVQIATHRDNWDVVANWKDHGGDDWSIDALQHKESSFSFINNRRKIWVQ